MIFNDSEPLRQEYQKVGETYEETEFDKQHKFVLQQIANDPNKKETITQMNRIMVNPPDEQYIVYIKTWEGVNQIGSYLSTTVSNIGIYPQFHPIYERFLQEDNTYGQRTISKNPVVAYFIPFTKATAEALHKLCNDTTSKQTQRTKYYAQVEGGTVITIASYHDWLNGSFDDLIENGKITIPTAPVQTTKQTKG